MILKELKAVLICMLLSFLLYELTGIIGKEMLSDKHINGKGKGYCNVVFGKKQDESLIINIQYNIFAPLIFTLFVAWGLQCLENVWLLERIILVVPFYYLIRGIMISVVTDKRKLYNISYEATTALLGCILAYIVQVTLILSKKNIMMTIEEFRTELWLIVFVLIYNFIINTWGKSSKLKQNHVCTNRMKVEYIFEMYDKFMKKYNSIIEKMTNDNYLIRIIYSIMIFENYNRPKTQRLFEYMKFFLCKQEMTLGIMQVSTTKYIDDRTSIELAMGIVKEAYEKYVKKENNGEGYVFGGAGEEELCLESICVVYNPSKDYLDAIKYMFYTLKAKEEGKSVEEIVFEQEEIENEEQSCEYNKDCFEQDEYELEDEDGDEVSERKFAEIYDLFELIDNLDKYEVLILEDDIEVDLVDHNIQTEIIRIDSNEKDIFIIQNVKNSILEGDKKSIVLHNDFTLELNQCENISISNLNIIDGKSSINQNDTLLRLNNCKNIYLGINEMVSEKRLAIEINDSDNIIIEGMKILNSNKGVIIVNNSKVSLYKVFVDKCKSYNRALMYFNSSVVDIEDSVIVKCECEKYIFENENSKIQCENVLISDCKFDKLCNQDNLRGVKSV